MSCPWYPDGVDQADIDQPFGGVRYYCRRCRHNHCECCPQCGATPDVACEPDCDCHSCIKSMSIKDYWERVDEALEELKDECL